jgi:hypothetical protein
MHERNKKAQIAGQIFIYILAVVLFGLILVYGMNAIQTFIKQGELVKMIELRSELRRSVSTISATENTALKQFVVPKKYRKLCFIELDQDNAGQNLCNPGEDDYNPIICNYWEYNKDLGGDVDRDLFNVFLVPMSDVGIAVGKIDAMKGISTATINDDHYSCFDVVNHKVKLKLEGKGNKAEISAWT